MDRLYEASNGKHQLEVSYTRIVEHTVMNTVSVVVTALEALMRSGNLPANIFEMVARAEYSARDLASRVNALAELFSPPDEISSVHMASYDAEQFLGALVQQLNMAIGDKMRGDVTFHIEAYEDRSVCFDARRVSLILYHLISNALRHGRTRNKNVKISYRKISHAAEISVRDYGGGIPEMDYDQLFTQYKDQLRQEPPSHMLPPRITGLGLPLCLKLAKDMGGDLRFKNFKTGAKFTLIIPQNDCLLREQKHFIPDETWMRSCMATFFLEEDIHDDNL